MLARRRDSVARGKLLHHFDVGDEARAGKDAFQQIVAEHGAVRDLSAECRLKRVDLVDALAAIGALLEQILVDVGYRERIRIEPIGAREDALEQRPFTADRQRRCHAWLQDAVTRDHQTGATIEARLVERMCDLPDQPLGGPNRQASVGIQRYDIADARWQCGSMPIGRHERRIGGAAEQAVELVQFATLAFPADPRPLALVPKTAPMQQEEARAVSGRPIASVQSLDAGNCIVEKIFVAGVVFGCRVLPVRKQGENEIVVLAG